MSENSLGRESNWKPFSGWVSCLWLFQRRLPISFGRRLRTKCCLFGWKGAILVLRSKCFSLARRLAVISLSQSPTSTVYREGTATGLCWAQSVDKSSLTTFSCGGSERLAFSPMPSSTRWGWPNNQWPQDELAGNILPPVGSQPWRECPYSARQALYGQIRLTSIKREVNTARHRVETVLVAGIKQIRKTSFQQAVVGVDRQLLPPQVMVEAQQPKPPQLRKDSRAKK